MEKSFISLANQFGFLKTQLKIYLRLYHYTIITVLLHVSKKKFRRKIHRIKKTHLTPYFFSFIQQEQRFFFFKKNLNSMGIFCTIDVVATTAAAFMRLEKNLWMSKHFKFISSPFSCKKCVLEYGFCPVVLSNPDMYCISNCSSKIRGLC